MVRSGLTAGARDLKVRTQTVETGDDDDFMVVMPFE
jgi:hypothetical protein